VAKRLGGADVADSKRIMISLPESLLAEVDDVVTLENRNRSEFIREAINSVLHERRKRGIREQMRRGYQEMAQLNLAIAKELFSTEEEVKLVYEEVNVECQR
jgi:CopG family transcriptional regulator / antitoxin EndoAI